MSNQPRQNQQPPQRPPMMGGGRHSRMMGFKEKPKAAKQTLLRVLKYIASFKTLFIALIIIVIVNTADIKITKPILIFTQCVMVCIFSAKSLKLVKNNKQIFKSLENKSKVLVPIVEPE